MLFRSVELGAEGGRSVLDGVNHPFARVKTFGVDDALTITGPCVVFSNELFDAQPFRRFTFRDGHWRERGVTLREDHLAETLLESTPLPEAVLPTKAEEGYCLDLPLAARRLADRIAREPWTGIFIAFDYGKSWAELTGDSPHGTARAYRLHQQSNDLLAHPGDQDLTCHVCWDWIIDRLRAHGFAAHADQRNNQLRIINNHCPFGDVAIENPVICAVDRGMVKGMLGALYGDADVSTQQSLAQGDTFCATTV